MNLSTESGANDKGARMEEQKKYNQCVKTCACGGCPQDGMCRAWATFVDKHSKCKGYTRFNKHVSLGMDYVHSYVIGEKKVAAHGFYPFIHFEKTQVWQERLLQYPGKGKRDWPSRHCLHIM